MINDIFQKVSEIEKPNILETIGKSWYQHFLLHQYIHLMSENSKKSSLINQTLFHIGSLESGVFLIQTEFLIFPDPFTIFFTYTTSLDLSLLKKALMETQRIPWNSTRYIFEITLDRFTPVLCNVFVSKGLKAMVQHYLLLWLPPEIPVNLPEPPADVFIGFLNKSHALDVSRNWPTFPGCEQFIAEEISVGCGIGLFRKTDRKMLSSILSFHSGGVFMLYSLPEVRRKGYGEITLRYGIKELRQQNKTPFCTVFSDNIPSLQLVKKVGFRVFDKANYIFPTQFFQCIN